VAHVAKAEVIKVERLVRADTKVVALVMVVAMVAHVAKAEVIKVERLVRADTKVVALVMVVAMVAHVAKAEVIKVERLVRGVTKVERLVQAVIKAAALVMGAAMVANVVKAVAMAAHEPKGIVAVTVTVVIRVVGRVVPLIKEEVTETAKAEVLVLRAVRVAMEVRPAKAGTAHRAVITKNLMKVAQKITHLEGSIAGVTLNR